MEKLKSQPRPQNYRRNYFLVLQSGLLGCKWHRYKQSKEASGKWNLISAAITTASFLYTSFIFYVWMVLDNDYYTLVTTRTLEWDISFYTFGLVLICILLSYHAIIFLLCLLHIHHGFQLYVHPFHLLVCLVSILGCTTVIILLCTFHFKWLALMGISLKVAGPFVNLGILIAMTLVCFVLIRQWLLTSWRWGKWVALACVSVIMLCLYFAPLGIDSPLVADSTPSRPGVVALGGSANKAPINSKVAFEKSIMEKVDGLFVTVQFSSDGVPFIFGESSLHPWTDAMSRLPVDDKGLNPVDFTIEELRNLSNGHWYLHHDPFSNVDDLTQDEKISIDSVPILTLKEFLDILSFSQPPYVFAKEAPLSEAHPLSLSEKYAKVNSTLRGHLEFYNSTKIYWRSVGENLYRQVLYPHGAANKGQLAVYLEYEDTDDDKIRHYHEKNITVMVGAVNTDWMLSYFHLLSVDFIATYHSSYMMAYRSPVWRLTHPQYKGLWISVDLVSILSIVIFYIFLRVRLFGARFSPESISLNTGRPSRQYRCRNMKEKLLREGGGLDALEDTEMHTGRGLENQQTSSASTYAITSCSGSILGHDPAPSTMTMMTSGFGSNKAVSSGSVNA